MAGKSVAAIALLVGTVCLLVVLLSPGAALAVSYNSQEIALINLVNDYRVSLGLQPLMVSDLASSAAEKHSSDMGKYGFFSHSTVASDWFPAGARADTRLAMCGYSYQVAWGETIAAGQSMAQTVFNAWRNSPDHDTVMKGSAFRVVGVGQVYTDGSPYGYYWTLDFGGYVDATAHWVGSEPSTTSTSTTTTSTTSTTLPTTTTTTAPSSTTTSTTIAGQTFLDVPQGSTFYAEITSLATDGVLSGCADGLFHPNDPVTRAQFAKIIVLALGEHTTPIDNAAAPSYSDVPFAGASYPFDYVEEAAALGIIEGFADGTFRPQSNVTRAQLALMLTRAGGARLMSPPVDFPCPFMDVPAYARDAVRIAVFNSLVDGKTPSIFDPYGQATRGQVAKMVYRLRQALGL